MNEFAERRLTKLDEMFGELNTPVKEVSNKIDVDLLIPYKEHPFKPYTGNRFNDMVKSIRELGVIQPIIIRPIAFSKEFEILAGHNRWRAAQAAGLTVVPFILMEGLTEEEARQIVTETNLIQRSFKDLQHSERAYVLAQHYEALKAQGKRLDIINEVKRLLDADKTRENTTSRPVGEKLDADEKTGKEYDIGARTVSRYLRINELVSELKGYIDDESISIRAGVELSYLSEDNQLYLVDVLNNNKIKISEDIASNLRKAEEANKLNEKSLMQVLVGAYKNSKKEKSILKGFKVKSNVMKKYFNEKQSAQEVEGIINEALELYFSAKSK